MADQQPEALKHAEWLERSLTIGAPEAAAELRRLHEREEGLQTQVDLLTASVEWRGRENATLRAHVERLQSELEMRTDESVRYRAVLDAKGVVIEEMRQEIERLQAAGQVAAPAMVPVSDSGIDDLAEALLEVTTSEVVSPESARAFARAVESISAKLNGLTVGDRQASGRVD